jgi:hypothetical protein
MRSVAQRSGISLLLLLWLGAAGMAEAQSGQIQKPGEIQSVKEEGRQLNRRVEVVVDTCR